MEIKIIIFSLVFLLSLAMVANSVSALSGIKVVYPNEPGITVNGVIDITWTCTCTGLYSENISIYWGKGGALGNPASSDLIVKNLNCSWGNYSSWDTSAAPDGDGTDYQVKVRATDDADIGNWSDNFFTIDNTAPTVSSVNPILIWGGSIVVGIIAIIFIILAKVSIKK